MIIVKIKPVGDPACEKYSEHNVQFKNSSSMSKEILPTVFKQKEMATGSVVWIDSLRTCKRYQLTGIVRPLMAPIRLSNTGFRDRICGYLEEMITSTAGLNVINSIGERFVITMTRVESSSDQSDTNIENAGKSGERESDSPVRVSTVPVTALKKTAVDIFAEASGYVPSKVSRTL